MKLWQATWDLSGKLVLWAARSARNADPSQFGSSTPAIRPLPGAVSSTELAETLEELGYPPDGFESVEIKLPVDFKGCVDSPRQFSEESPLENEVLQLQSFSVEAAYFSPAPAISFLTSLPQHPPSGNGFDNSVMYWVDATKLLLEFLTRGRYLPSITAREDSYAAFWHVVPNHDEDVRRLGILAQEMPPICRALRRSAEPSSILESFITTGTDALIRSFLSKRPLTEQVKSEPRTTGQAVALTWLNSLTAADPQIKGPLFELAQLEQRLKRWNKTSTPSSPQGVRSCFRLLPPDPRKGDNWTLEFLLQSKHDASQLLSLRNLWRSDLGFLLFSEQTVAELEENALRDLGKSSSIFAPIRQALIQQFPYEIGISTEEAYLFLKEAAPAFEEEGFTVLIPDWWKARKERSIGLHINLASPDESPPRTAQTGFLGLQELVDFSWELSLGGELVSVEEFRKLLDQRAPLIQVKGQWIEFKHDDIEATLEFLEKKEGDPRMRLLDALRLGMGVESEALGLPVVGLSTEGWIQRLVDQQAARAAEPVQPEGFLGELRPYQQAGLTWLSFLSAVGCGGCLADDMGLGKTVQFLALLAHERHEQQRNSPGVRLNPTLLIVPMSILDNWEREARKFTPQLKTYQHHGTLRLSFGDFERRANESDLVITTYNLAHRDENIIGNVEWGRVALDEAQNIKNAQTKQTKAIRRLIHNQLSNNSTKSCHRIALTGTPLENHLDELWSIFDFLNPGYLGSGGDFRSRFSIPIERYRSAEASAQLSQLIRPFVLRRLKTDRSVITDLPEKIEMDEFTSLSPEQAVLYQSVLQEMLPQFDRTSGIKRKGLVLAAITKLKQICDHPQLVTHDRQSLSNRSGKLSRLEELLEVILAEGDKVLIFTQFAQMGILLKNHLQERFNQPVLILHGQIPQKARSAAVDQFQQENGPKIFVLSLKVGGVGLNLTAANQIIHYDQWWNPAVQEQATDRAFRIGQKRNVQVRRFICKGTLEERIAELVQHKRQLAQTIVGETRSSIAQLSTEELKDLLRLAAPIATDDRFEESSEELD